MALQYHLGEWLLSGDLADRPDPRTGGQTRRVFIQLDSTDTGEGVYYDDGISGTWVQKASLGGGSGTVTSFSAGDLSPLFTTTEANPTTTPALSFAAITQAANLFYAGPVSGSAAAPAFRALVAADIPIVRERLTTTVTYYVRTDGDDGNTGLVDSAGGAFLTIQKAIDVVTGTLDLGGQNVVIQVRNGTYTPSLNLKPPFGGTVTLRGDTTTPSNVLLSVTSANVLNLNNSRGWTVEGFKLQTITGGNVVVASNQSSITLRLFEIGAAAGAGIHFFISNSSSLNITGSYTISGGAFVHWYVVDNSTIVCRLGAAAPITLTGTPAFSFFAVAVRSGTMWCGFNTFTGSATGTRFESTRNGAIDTEGHGLNYFPGDVDGIQATGGQYT